LWCLLLVLCLAALWDQAAGNTWISDSRIRNPNLAPALGRGFSESTSEVSSTCLAFGNLTEPTYNFQYHVTEVNEDGESESSTTGSIEASLSYGFVSASIRGSLKEHDKTKKHKHYLVTRMAMERYYSSIDDKTASLSKDAASLLEKEDVVGFFQSCGSGYIRSIRRVAEVTAIFEFTTEEEEKTSAKEAALEVKSFLYGAGLTANFGKTNRQRRTKSEMTIRIQAFGLGLNLAGAQSLTPRSLEEYDEAMRFAFESMQSQEVGMIHGVEIVSWANNLQFQNRINFQGTFKKECHIATNGTLESPNEHDAPSCEDSSLVSFKEGKERLGGIVVKSITMANAEFISMLESVYRREMQTTQKLSKCLGELSLLMKNADTRDRKLVDHTRHSSFCKNTAQEDDFSVERLFKFLEKRYEVRSENLQAFVNGIYGPCVSRLLQASNNGLMTQSWFDKDMKNFCKMDCLIRPNLLFGKEEGKHTFECAEANKEHKNAGDYIEEDSGYSIDTVVEKFCMPMLHHA